MSTQVSTKMEKATCINNVHPLSQVGTSSNCNFHTSRNGSVGRNGGMSISGYVDGQYTARRQKDRG